jgi:hypothetical protein
MSTDDILNQAAEAIAKPASVIATRTAKITAMSLPKKRHTALMVDIVAQRADCENAIQNDQCRHKEEIDRRKSETGRESGTDFVEQNEIEEEHINENHVQ